ncbi:MAG: SPOR domain-containing protein [Pseudomonadota bacterium]|nr:SPOR domain-containing protein [Pseudomonadota bacterium]
MSDELNSREVSYRAAYRPARSRGADPATKRLALIAAGLGSAMVVLIGIWSATNPASSTVPVIAPPAGPLRVKPLNPGGMKVAGESDILLSGRAGDAVVGKLAPPPEAPDPEGLRPPPRTTTLDPAPKMPAVATPPPPAATPSQDGKSANPGPVSPAVDAAAVDALGGTSVQLASLPTKEQAETEWRALQHRMPDVFGDRAPAIVRADVAGHTWWRVRTGGFAEPALARVFCDRVRSKGGACSVARF